MQINVADGLEFSGDTLGTKPSTGSLQCDYQNRPHLDKVDQSDNRKNNWSTLSKWPQLQYHSHTVIIIIIRIMMMMMMMMMMMIINQ